MAKNLGKRKAWEYTHLFISALLTQYFYSLIADFKTIKTQRNQPRHLYVQANIDNLRWLMVDYIDSSYFLPSHQAIAANFLQETDVKKSKKQVKDIIGYLFDFGLAVNHQPECNTEDRCFSIAFPESLEQWTNGDATINRSLQWLLAQWQERAKPPKSTIPPSATLTPPSSIIVNPNPSVIMALDLGDKETILNLFPRSLYEYTRDRLQTLQPVAEQLLRIFRQSREADSSELIITLVRFLIANNQLTEANDLLDLSQDYLPEKSFNLDLVLSDRDYYRGLICLKVGNFPAAEPYLHQCRITRQKIFGNIHPQVAQVIHSLGALYLAQGRYREAEQWFRLSLAIRQQLPISRAMDFAIANATNSLAAVLSKSDDCHHDDKPVLSLYQQAMDLVQKHTNCHVFLADSYMGQAALYIKNEKFSLAQSLYLDAIGILETIFGNDHPELLRPRIALRALSA